MRSTGIDAYSVKRYALSVRRYALRVALRLLSYINQGTAFLSVILQMLSYWKSVRS